VSTGPEETSVDKDAKASFILEGVRGGASAKAFELPVGASAEALALVGSSVMAFKLVVSSVMSLGLGAACWEMVVVDTSRAVSCSSCTLTSALGRCVSSWASVVLAFAALWRIM
jgi:hypothetical protein